MSSLELKILSADYSGDTAMEDRDLCIAVVEDLGRMYPGYMWGASADLFTGQITLDIGAPKPIGLENYGYVINISTLLGPGGQAAVRRAGGEMLERFGLPRRNAPDGWREMAKDNGFDIS